MVDFDGNLVYERYIIKGTGYSPYPIGRRPADWGQNIFSDSGIYNRDLPNMQNMAANTVRIWKGDDTEAESNGQDRAKLTTAFLDAADARGIKVIAGFWIQPNYPWCNVNHLEWQIPEYLDNQNPNYANARTQIKNKFKTYVNTFKNHNAILFWSIGNENNHAIPAEYNGRTDFLAAWYSLVNEMAYEAHKAECPTYPSNCNDYHPVAVVNGDINTIGVSNYGSMDNLMTHLNIWGANVYYGNSFGQMFDNFAAKTTKPLWLSEYGTDAYFSIDPYNPEVGYEDEETQASWVGTLWDQIIKNNDVCIGATLMEYSDEWWKANSDWAEDYVHNYNGFGPTDTGCPLDGNPGWYPPSADNYFNEEWWGIMSIVDNGANPDIHNPREVYTSLQNRFECNENNGGIYYAGPDNYKSCDGMSSACCSNPYLKSKYGNCVASCGGGCFLADTLVLMADGTIKPIQKIKAGDNILSYNEEKKGIETAQVTQLLTHPKENEYLIINNSLKVTAIHPVLSDGEWKPIGQLKVGDNLTNVDGKNIKIETIEKINAPVDIYNFEVEPNHTYVVKMGNENIIVHNRKLNFTIAVDGNGSNY